MTNDSEPDNSVAQEAIQHNHKFKKYIGMQHRASKAKFQHTWHGHFPHSDQRIRPKNLFR